MRKENTWNISLATEHPEMSEEANLKMSYTPGKKGGNFGLPLGAKISVPEGIFGKKDTITCQVSKPSQRWRHFPVLPSYEHITSEIFLLYSSVHPLKKSVIVQLPYYPVDHEHCDLNVKGKWKDEKEWVDVGFLKKEDAGSPSIELDIDRLGVFVVTFTPKKEVFPVTSQGCLYNARLNRHISIRFPKKAVDSNIQCTIQITPIPPEKILSSKGMYPLECGELVTASEFIDIIPSATCNFRRPATVKLPLPSGVEVHHDEGSDMVVLQKTPDGWSLVESNYKFTRTTVSCDVRFLSRFCVAKSKPERRKKMKDAIQVVEVRNDREKGDIGVFLSVKDKSWMAVVECFPESKSEQIISERVSSGFRFIKKQEIPKVEVERTYYNRRAQPPKQYKPKEIEGFEIFDGMQWAIEFKEDIKACFDSDHLENKELKFFKCLPESYRRFLIEPKTNEEKSLSGLIELVPLGLEDETLVRQASFIFNVEIDEETVQAYFKPDVIPEEPEPEKPKVTFELPVLEPIKEVNPAPPPVPRLKTFSPDVLDRLTRSTRKPNRPERESRVLSGKSLMNIARVVPEGLTLAVHLDLPDSTITGLGFDAISNGLGMADVTYKILLYWKRRLKNKRDAAVDELTMALRDMGKSYIADVILENHQANKEISPNSFQVIY